MEIKDNKVTYAVALLVLILIVGIGILSYNMDFNQSTSGKAINIPREVDMPQKGSSTGKVSIEIISPPEGGGE
ncbi:MAG: hypothetical protein JSW73_03065 [Candidatus Woesearchaeota archaeon]|nr:MAG: hypothetical protein JSW73_03065 [Candidatus Woesearchaeota archaeon]